MDLHKEGSGSGIYPCRYIYDINAESGIHLNSGAGVRISNTVIGGTFYDEQNTSLENVTYEEIWRG